MAATQGSQQPVLHSTTSGFWPHSTASTAAASRLRDSCNACASSKVRCSKEKPTCSRCAKRNTACEYLITKRPGRKHESRKSESNINPSMMPLSTAETRTSPTTTNWPTTFPSAGVDLSFTSPYPIQPAAGSEFPGLVSTDFDDFLTSPMSFSLPDAPDFDMLDQSETFTGADSTSVSGKSSNSKTGFIPNQSEDIIYLFGDQSRSSSVPSGKSNQHKHKSNTPEQAWRKNLDAAPCCLSRALEDLSKLSSEDAMRCTALGLNGDQDRSKRRLSSTVQAVIYRNQAAFDDMERMLSCSCSANSFLVTIMALVVFKALDWYTSAVHSPTEGDEHSSSDSQSVPSPSSSRSTTISTGQYSDDTDIDCKSAQLVLVELHRVQQFLTKLSPKIRACGSLGTSDSTEGHDADLLLGNEKTRAPFSTTVLDNLEPELRKRVRALSLDIIRILRRD